MAKLIAYPLTIIYYIFFGLSLAIFHPLQMICLNIFGYQAHKKSVDVLNLFLTRCLHILGARYTFKVPKDIPENVPAIIVANHQSMNDIPPIIWFMRRFHVKFISKKELGKGLPSVSYNLRHGGSVLIDRKNPVQAVNAIKKMANYIETYNRAVVIFPEGSRSRNGKPKPFKTKGLKTLLEHAPHAIVVPITINNSWKLLRYGKFPMGLGAQITFTVHKSIKVNEHPADELINMVEKQITEAVII